MACLKSCRHVSTHGYEAAINSSHTSTQFTIIIYLRTCLDNTQVDCDSLLPIIVTFKQGITTVLK